MHAKTGANRCRTNYAVTPAIGRMVQSFAQTYRAKVEEWASRLQVLEHQSRKVVVWGAGAKATTFLNLLKPKVVEYVVDVNPRKHGKYVAGTGQQIVPPEFLCNYAADEIISMNPNYLEEIARWV